MQFYIDFWNQINDDLGVNYTFVQFDNNLDVITALKAGYIDIGLGISITWKRASEVEFTQPIADGSLRIMTYYASKINIWEMFMPFHWSLWITILIVALVNGHIVWWVERDSNTTYFPKFYFSGIREGLWFSFMNMMMMDDAVVRSFPVRLPINLLLRASIFSKMSFFKFLGLECVVYPFISEAFLFFTDSRIIFYLR